MQSDAIIGEQTAIPSRPLWLSYCSIERRKDSFRSKLPEDDRGPFRYTLFDDRV